jgi:hypothetical protein
VLVGLPGVPGGERRLALAVEVGEQRLELGHGVRGTGAGLGVRAAPLVVLGAADRLLDLAHPPFQVLHPLAWHLAGRIPTVGDVAEGLLGGAQVGDRHQCLGLGEQRLLLLGVGRELAVQLGVRRVPGAEEGVLRAAEPLPQLVVDVLRCRTGLLPLAHEVAVAPGGRAPVRRTRQRLRLDDQLLLHLTR